MRCGTIRQAVALFGSKIGSAFDSTVSRVMMQRAILFFGVHVEHDFEHGIFEHGAKTASSCSEGFRLVNDGVDGTFIKVKLHTIHRKQFLVLLQERIFRLEKDITHGFDGQVVQRRNDGKTSDQFGNQSKTNQVVWFNVLEDFRVEFVNFVRLTGCKTDGARRNTTRDNITQAIKGTATNEGGYSRCQC